MRLLLRVTGFKNADDVAKVWVHAEGSTWYTDDGAWHVANHDIDPDTNSLVTYVDGVPSGSEGAPCTGNQTHVLLLVRRHLRSRVACAPLAAVGVFVLHDKNNDGRASTDWLGMPEEGMTASNGARGGFPVGHPCGGDPCWDEAKMAVDAATAGCVIIDMPMWYP